MNLIFLRIRFGFGDTFRKKNRLPGQWERALELLHQMPHWKLQCLDAISVENVTQEMMVFLDDFPHKTLLSTVPSPVSAQKRCIQNFGSVVQI